MSNCKGITSAQILEKTRAYVAPLPSKEAYIKDLATISSLSSFSNSVSRDVKNIQFVQLDMIVCVFSLYRCIKMLKTNKSNQCYEQNANKCGGGCQKIRNILQYNCESL